MIKPTFVWLGSRRARKRGVGDKGRWLDQASSAGLPVPAGAILLDEVYQLFLAEAIITADDSAVLVPDPAFLHETLYRAVRLPRLDRPAAVRAAFSAGDDSIDVGLGPFAHRLWVDLEDASQLASSLAAIWSSGLRWGESILERGGVPRRDVLLMEMVDGDVCGQATSHPDSEWDEATFETNADSDSLRLPRLGAWRNPDPALPPFAQRLQRLLRGARRTFGRQAYQIEWIDDGRTCWLLRARPLT